MVRLKSQNDGNVEVKKRGRKKKNKAYFTEDTQTAIIEYNNERNQVKRNLIYNSRIKYPFEKLAENVLNTFKFSYFDEDTTSVKCDVVSFMIEKIHLYDGSKGKAFSYFSIIAKNYLILNNNSNYKKFKIHDSLDSLDVDRDAYGEMKSSTKNIEDKEFISMLIQFWETNMPHIFKKQKDIAIADSVIHLFRTIDNIENFNKKTLYVYIREMTGAKTQQITKIINVMKKYYKDLLNEFQLNGNLSYEMSDGGEFF